MASLSSFHTLLTQPAPPGCFNPWRDNDPTTDLHPDAPTQRLARLERHLNGVARFLRIGEAPGYQGAKVSGIPFTSERLMGEGSIPRITLKDPRLSKRIRPWSEPSATIVWHTLAGMGISAIPLRPPSMGGATAFRRGLHKTIR